jgi:hypothetical protein
MVRDALIHALPPAQVGLLAAEARVGTRAARILRRLCRDNDRAVTSGHHIEVIARRGSTIIAGTGGPKQRRLAVTVGQKRHIGAFAGPLPDRRGGRKRAATTYFVRDLTTAQVRRIIERLRRLG